MLGEVEIKLSLDKTTDDDISLSHPINVTGKIPDDRRSRKRPRKSYGAEIQSLVELRLINISLNTFDNSLFPPQNCLRYELAVKIKKTKFQKQF